MLGKDPVDIVIIVPKEDELRGLQWAWGISIDQSDGQLDGGKLYYQFNHRVGAGTVASEFTIVVVFMNDQGNSHSAELTQQVLSKCDPALILLVGTAAGHKEKTSIGSVVVSQLIIDAQEWKLSDRSTPRTRHHEPPEKIKTDMVRFIGNRLSYEEWREKLKDATKKLSNEDLPESQWTNLPKVDMAVIASSNYLHLDYHIEKLFNSDERILCIDMESGGFGSVCKKFPQRQWIVIRGISDYGTQQSKKEEFRILSSYSAGLFTRMFVEGGLVETHPYALKVPESDKKELSSDNFYTQYDIVSTIKDGVLRELGLDLRGVDFTGYTSFSDLVAICISHGGDTDSSKKALFKLREDYFTNKYIDYTYENDLRGLIPTWGNEIKEILYKFGVELENSTVLDVGIGNGIEALYLFTEVGELIGADISKAMIKKANKYFPSMRPIHAPAECLDLVKTNSIDIYISLRTYQSSLFEVGMALREAQRVLNDNGIIIISIANGFVDLIDGTSKIVRGLLVPGSRRIVDKNTPRRLMGQIVDKMTDLGFRNIGFSLDKTDIYIYAQRA